MSLEGILGGIYSPLSQENIETIHNAALTILEKTGVGYERGLEDTIDMLEKAGARVNRHPARVTFPRKLILEKSKMAPEKVNLYSRGGKHDLDLTGNKVHMGTGGAAIKILDLETGKARPTILRDLYQIARLVDNLENIHFFLRPCIPTDLHETEYDINVFYACMKATGKHVMVGVNDEDGLHQVIDMASMVAGSMTRLQEKPFFSVITSFSISPLKLCTASTKIMQEAIRHKIPVALSAAPMSGSTSPMTMAGTLAQLHAEQLAGICICQLTNPGSPLLYGGIPGMANMNSMGYRGGGVECGMMNAAIHQLAQYIRVPNYNSSGLSDSKVPDAQAGWEKGMTSLLVAMGGSNFIHHAAGMLESMLAVAYEQYVIDDEIIGMCCKVLKGIDVDPEHLALEVIDAVGPGGSFISSEHTLAHIRNEYFFGNGISDQKGREQWEDDGAEDAWMRARKIVRSILAEKEKSYIPDELDKRIREKFKIQL